MRRRLRRALWRIAINGTVIEPGDLILGVLCVPKADAADIFKAATGKHEAETEAGTINREWVDKALRDAGFEFID